MNKLGPVPISKEARMETCRKIADRLHEKYGKRIKAIGVYGSIARGMDGPYSDIEMFCVLRKSSEAADDCYEWSAGPWKAEVDVMSEHVLLCEAAEIEGRWPLTHGPFFTALALYDPEEFFPKLKAAAESPPASEFRRAICEVLVGEMYEFAGKLRNASLHGPDSYLPYLAMQFAHNGAMILGLHHRTLFTTGARVLPEALALPDRPQGYDELAGLIMSGELADPERIVTACEAYWQGLTAWAAKHHYAIVSPPIPF
ncbi:ANT(4')-I family aminoglycoside nucleotidyltransferase [Paenibacillus melissococcoides]|uniref:ANT(4')-I family aminoglycoside nucleotidyltransferase n=1 Tax=Paenibacillus melissococcoides TaxID=2912268 RepID=A0ABN8UEI7_9BACL|nr:MULTISPECIES: ANT(4')-I family aminoglycoside nucleotidyltransferase [Paenibacillus]MEB9895831.1 ANT(4')-I family aminoglycoside nucleotidyltransferase [Bacillus cereus]CAH8249625.1 ANT(4')-I family aminoglycoside nucleotidyltransferase [Paenibacillus melissococcoides]CAH8721414.1 ANT(4')-I family aminoglycoside nucleotidyltransferase [Paenibacillus melissococcoides]CAH8721806.1 ANT(4')-I family aminoglycoside nucleotidyltransferase [Paenibacillus melissococcoides]GIO80742.1 aminoglycoside 